MTMIQSRASDIRQRTIQRVRAESTTYLVMVFLPVLMWAVNGRSTVQTLVTGFGVLAIVGPILSVLAYKEYRLRTLPLSGSLRQSLAVLLAAIDSTSRYYFATYMICVLAGIGWIVGMLIRSHGPTWFSAGALIAGAVCAFWSWRSGQAYARRMFGRYRAELMRSLEELEAA